MAVFQGGNVQIVKPGDELNFDISRIDKVKDNKRCSLNCEYFNAEDNGVYRCKKYFVQTALGRECRDSDPSFQPLHEEVYFPDVDTTAKHDVVNHPSHYETGKFECFDVMREAFGDEAVKNFCICNAFKYLYRHQRKNGIEDIRKAKWYIDHFLEIVDEGLSNE